MTTEITPTHTVAYAHHKRAHGLLPLTQWQCACGQHGEWTDRDTAKEQGAHHERSGQ